MDENTFSHVNVISKQNITRANFRSSGKFSRGKDRQKWITSETPGLDWRKVLQTTFSIL